MDKSFFTECNLSEKEQKILNAAVDIISIKGFATTKEIAMKAGVAEGTIFRYYKTKDCIVKEIK